MKKINYILAAAVVVAFQACDLDLNPHTSYNENNVNVKNDSESQYSTRTDMLGLRNSSYDHLRCPWNIASQCRRRAH